MRKNRTRILPVWMIHLLSGVMIIDVLGFYLARNWLWFSISLPVFWVFLSLSVCEISSEGRRTRISLGFRLTYLLHAPQCWLREQQEAWGRALVDQRTSTSLLMFISFTFLVSLGTLIAVLFVWLALLVFHLPVP